MPQVTAAIHEGRANAFARMVKEAHHLENAVKHVLSQGLRTADIMQDGMKKISTGEMGDAIVKALGNDRA